MPRALRLRGEPGSCGRVPGPRTASLTPSRLSHRLSDSAFDSLRLWVLVVLCLLRLSVTRPHLQAYLCLAKARVERLRREAGRIEAREIQRRVPTLAGRDPGARGVGSRPLGLRLPEREGPRCSHCYLPTRWCGCTAT